MKKDDRKVISAYTITWKTWLFVALTLIVLLLALFGFRAWKIAVETQHTQSIIDAARNVSAENAIEEFRFPVMYNVLSAIEDGLITVITILVSSFLSVLLIGKRDQNSIYSEAFSDVYNDSEVQLVLNENGSCFCSIKKELETNHIPLDMFQFSAKKIAVPEKPYYYEECNIEITCSIKDNMLHKRISKTILLRSFNDTYTFSSKSRITEYVIAQYCGTAYNQSPITIECLKVNGKNLNCGSCVSFEKYNIDVPLENKQGCTRRWVAYYNRDLTINNKTNTEIIVDYTTCAPLNDLTYVFRLPCACKKTHFRYQLEGMPNYKLTGHAFGFFDDANSSHNTKQENVLDFRFENWIFQRDGICINMTKSAV